MQIQINTDGNIEGTEQLAAQAKGLVESSLSRFSDQITRIEVHGELLIRAAAGFLLGESA